ncbi:hypothetical protein D9C73_024589 [Collichthys lucidus]|uniref:Interferon gamma n=1 Tax=Collichthys lucidus TaxID=240159 RepID=A0A4U5VPG1_COLLU|nr:hypothetical protein D9C73_024589 [Collichthys lucidus]
MSSCSGSVCLLVLLGVVFASGNLFQYVSEDLTNIHESLAVDLGLKSPGLSSNPQLNSVIRSINTSCQRKDVQLMNVTLDIYMRIFSSILHHNKPGAQTLLGQVSDSKRPQVESALKGLEKKMKELKQRLDHQNPDSEDVMRNLNKIKVNDLVVQKQALAQYKEIYQAASVIRGRCGPARHRRR